MSDATPVQPLKPWHPQSGGGPRFVNSLKLIQRAVSLGGVESLIEHPASMTHASYSPEELKAAGISQTLIRISVGIEDVEDIIADLDQAFAAM